MSLDIDKPFVRDLNGLIFPQGDFVASIGWVQLPVSHGEIAYTDDGMLPDNLEQQSMDYPSFVLGAPNFAGLEKLVQAFSLNKHVILILMQVKWLPDHHAVELTFSGKNHKLVLEPAKMLLPPITVTPGGSTVSKEYMKAWRDATNAPGCVLSLLETIRGTAQNTLFTKISGDKHQAMYKRFLTSSQQAKFKVR